MTEHDEAIETAETLAELTSKDSLTKEEKQEALRALSDITICVRECDCLTIYLGKTATDVFEAIEESMEEANEQGVTLTGDDATIRPSLDEIVA